LRFATVKEFIILEPWLKKSKQNKIKQNKKNHDMMLLSGILDIITQGLTVTMALYSAIIFRFSDNSGHICKLV